MADKISRHEQLVRAAKGRAIITSYLNTKTEPVPRGKILEDCGDRLAELNYTESSLDNFLYTMGNSGLLTKKPDPTGKLYLWSTMPSDGGKVPLRKAPSSKVKDKQDKASPAAITLDIIKSSGRVRLTINGLVIEVGVIE